jgi:hypothetical protein
MTGEDSVSCEAASSVSVFAGPAAQDRLRRPPKTFSAAVAREICRRTLAGEAQREICADPAMPSPDTLRRWAQRHPRFAQTYARARALGEREGFGVKRSYCQVTAVEIAARMSEGESLAAIAREPGMPSLSTIFRWARQESAFAEDLAVARMVMAERFAEMGWTLAMEATPGTAYLTQVRLKQLRWTCAILSPTTYGRLKAADPPAPPDTLDVTLRTFQMEVNPETGQVRSVAYHHDPQTGKNVSDLVGEWVDPPFPLVRKVDYVEAKRTRMALGMNTDDPSQWDLRPSAKERPAR